MATQNEKAVIDLVINGKQSEVSMKALTAATIDARKALYKMAETDPGYAKQKAQLEALMKAQQARIVKIHEEKTAWQKFKESSAGALNITAGITGASVVEAGFQAIKSSVAAGIRAYREFDAASKELSAVTGLTGQDLEYLNRQAKQTGPIFGKSGAEMLEAYKLMASAKPELLEQKELLAETTKAALTLSQAGKIDLAEATSVTAESLNQFGEGADQANRYINVIAAGAKEGSAEINQMGAALKNSGTVAASQNVSFEQTNAVLQSMSTIALKGGEAGTMFRNVLLTLGSGADDTNPKVVGLETALDNLGKKNMSTAQITKMFGKENVVAAQHIIAHRNEIAELTQKVSGTQEAFTQAAANNKSFDHQLEVFNAKVEKLAVALGTVLIPALTAVVSVGTGIADLFSDALTPASEKATAAFEDQRGKVNDLEKNLGPLLKRHDELMKITNRSTGEQAELKKIVGQVAAVVPSAATEFDKYGNALSVNTGKAREFIKVQKELLKYNNKVAIQETDKELAEKQKQLDASVAKRRKGTVVELTTVGVGGQYKERKLTEAEMEALDNQNKTLAGQLADLEARKKGLDGSYLDTPATTPKTKTAPTPPATGGGSGETDKERKARERKEKAAQRTHDREVKAEQRQEDSLEKMLSDAHERTAKLNHDSFQAEQVQFGERYSKMLELAGTNKEQMDAVTEMMYQELGMIQKRETEKNLQQEYQRNVSNMAQFRDQQENLIELEVMSGLKTRQQGDEAQLQLEEKYIDASELMTRAYYKTLSELAQGDAEKIKQIESDKNEVLTKQASDRLANAQRQKAAKREPVDKALDLDQRDLQQKHQEDLLSIRQNARKKGQTEVQVRNLEMAAERQFLLDKQALYEKHYQALLKLGILSKEELAIVERAKNQETIQIGEQLLNTEQQQYQGRLGSVLKFLDEKQQYMTDAVTVLQSVFAVDQQKMSVGPLLEELDQLQHKTALTSAEQDRMKTIISQIGQVMPDAVTGTDAYGQAISLNTDKAREEVDAQKRRANIMQKVALAEKAWALASIGINYGQALMAAVKSSIGMPFPANLAAVASSMAIPTLQAGVATAKILGSKIDAPAFAEGGFTNVSDPSGFTSGPTYFQKGNYIAGEAGREWIMSAPMLKNPVMANLAGALQAMQTSGSYKNLQQGNAQPSGASTGGNGNTDSLLLAIHEQLQTNNQKMDAISRRPIKYNSFKIREHEEYLQQIETETSL